MAGRASRVSRLDFSGIWPFHSGIVGRRRVAGLPFPRPPCGAASSGRWGPSCCFPFAALEALSQASARTCFLRAGLLPWLCAPVSACARHALCSAGTFCVRGGPPGGGWAGGVRGPPGVCAKHAAIGEQGRDNKGVAVHSIIHSRVHSFLCVGCSKNVPACGRSAEGG